jgi:transcription elongation factor Elf1
MSDRIPIRIPADDEGYITLHCPHCRASFKALTADLDESDDADLHCAACGLSHERMRFLLTPELSGVIQAEVHNKVADLLNEFSAGLERSFRGSKSIKMKSRKVEKRTVPTLRAITDLAQVELHCCETRIKVEFDVAASLLYCPFCGQAQT